MIKLPDLIHSGGSLLAEGQAGTPTPPLGVIFLSTLIRGDVVMTRFGRVTKPPDLIHSGGLLLEKGQAGTPVPPWHIFSRLLLEEMLC